MAEITDPIQPAPYIVHTVLKSTAAPDQVKNSMQRGQGQWFCGGLRTYGIYRHGHRDGEGRSGPNRRRQGTSS